MNGSRKKKLLIHLGFPKTASSSLQYGLFKKLDHENLLKLFMWRKDDMQEHLDLRPSSRFFNHQDLPYDYLQLDSKLINILSDESFTAPTRLRENNYGKDIEDPINFPKKIKELYLKHFGSEIDFRILIVIRNQADLIFSQFVEEYKLVLNKGINILFDSDGNIDLNGYDVYNYYRYISELHSVFGADNVKTLFFEDLKRNPDFFYSEVAKTLNIDTHIVQGMLSQSHINKKRKSSNGYYTYGSNILIPSLSYEQRFIILKHFEDGNKKLKSLNFNLDSLKEYGFFVDA